MVGYPVSVDPGDSAARQRGRRSRGSLQVSCDWSVRMLTYDWSVSGQVSCDWSVWGHMTGCSPLIGQNLVR